MKNFHTHTYLCKHAVGVPKDYAASASKEHFSALGFSDHCPYFDDMWLGMHMERSQVPLYRQMVEDARSITDIPVYFGFECEWHSRYQNWYRDTLIGEYGAQYLIFGSHWVDIDGEFIYIPEVTNPKDIIRYIDLTIEGMESGLYDYLAHPDLFLDRVTEFTPFYADLSKKIIEAALAFNLPLEINGNGCIKPKIIRDGVESYRYPVAQFWTLAAEMNAHIILASDAHDPANVAANLRLAETFARDLGIQYDADYEPKLLQQ